MAEPGPRGILARGLGRSYGDAAQNAGGQVVDTSALSSVTDLDTDKGTVTAGAGASLDDLIKYLLPRGFFPAVTPGTRFVTVGGAIAADVHGKNHHRDGGFCDWVESFELVAPGAGPVKVGPRGKSADVFRATAGGMGLTGVITQARLKLRAVESAKMRVDTERANDLDEVMSLMTEGDDRYTYSVAWVDTLAGGAQLGRGVLTRAEHATGDELGARDRRHPLDFLSDLKLSVPPLVPSKLLNRAVALAFNEAWFRKAPRHETGRIVPILPYFYPLDAVGDWFNLYGPRGFVQYQFVVPFERDDVVREVLTTLAAERCPSFLAVLKRFGPGRGLLSFPIEGWTLALDIPAWEPGLSALLDRLDRVVIEAGGRVYLAKDSRMRPEFLAQMYPELDQWREIRERLDPEHRMCSDLDRRLGLTSKAKV